MQFWFWFILTVTYGACIGSFLNVVIYRLPQGRSLVRPASHCPKCQHALAWYDNLPVVGWLLLRGRCRYCRTPISIQYPAIEALTALLFAALMLCYYKTDLRPDFADVGLAATWPVFAVHLLLLASLLAATLIDARFYIIPLPIPWTMTLFAAIALPLGTLWDSQAVMELTFPVEHAGLGAAAGGMLGLGIAVLLLELKYLPLSFAEADAVAVHSEQVGPALDKDVPVSPDQWPAHPHPRREVLKECLFLVLPVAGAIIGWYLLRTDAHVKAVAATGLDRFFAPEKPPLPMWMVPSVQVLGGVALGYLVGGALVWCTRVLGTLGFGKEAMGLGDVHLLGAIGAVLGPIDIVYVFFAAPFMGLAIALASNLSKVLKGKLRVIPYGPYLALAALIIMIFRQAMYGFVDLRALLPN